MTINNQYTSDCIYCCLIIVRQLDQNENLVISEKIKPENHNKYIFDDLLVLFISYLFPMGIDIVKIIKFSVEIQWWLSDLK